MTTTTKLVSLFLTIRKKITLLQRTSKLVFVKCSWIPHMMNLFILHKTETGRWLAYYFLWTKKKENELVRWKLCLISGRYQTTLEISASVLLSNIPNLCRYHLFYFDSSIIFFQHILCLIPNLLIQNTIQAILSFLLLLRSKKTSLIFWLQEKTACESSGNLH